ncbi:BEST3 [Cordylochernes scorpioides]|uniref:Bestrophin homolog n=1 Tax=Cordylochernes scorpioides TaxID=51811 RepID=A0ABY6L0V2_9ARAC|nr:BEST3 [Cordylochernes scorpioides]
MIILLGSSWGLLLLIFERIVYYCATFVELIPLSFMLGFYVTFTATRWWNQYTAIPWPDRWVMSSHHNVPWPYRIMNIIALYMPGSDDTSRMMRRTLMRYVNLSLVLVLRSISMAVKKRFPTKEHLVEAGKAPRIISLSINDVWRRLHDQGGDGDVFLSPFQRIQYFLDPLHVVHQSSSGCSEGESHHRFQRHQTHHGGRSSCDAIIELNDFRTKCGLLWGYDWISIPLVYTQVVTVATYAFFIACMFARQYIESEDPIIVEKHKFDYYVPVFTMLQFIFYMGLLKVCLTRPIQLLLLLGNICIRRRRKILFLKLFIQVAEQLINPFGDDDEDFELNWIIDRHIKVSYLGVDTINCEAPPLVKDHYFDELDIKLPYTEAALEFKKKTYRGSVATMQVPMDQQHLVMPEVIAEEDEDEEQKNDLSQRNSSLWSVLGGPRQNSSLPTGSWG